MSVISHFAAGPYLSRWVTSGLFWPAVAFALIAGEREERLFASTSTLAALLDLAAGITHYGQDIVHEVAVDLCGLAIATMLALRSDKAWPLAIASILLAAIM